MNTLLPTTHHSFWWLNDSKHLGLVLATHTQAFEGMVGVDWLLVLVGGRMAWVDARQVSKA